MLGVRLLPSLSYVRALVLLHVATVVMLCCMVNQPYVVLLGVFMTMLHLMQAAALSDMYFDPVAWCVVHSGFVSGVWIDDRCICGTGSCMLLARMVHVYVFRIEWDDGRHQTLCLCRDALPPAAFSRLAMQWWEKVAKR